MKPTFSKFLGKLHFPLRELLTKGRSRYDQQMTDFILNFHNTYKVRSVETTHSYTQRLFDLDLFSFSWLAMRSPTLLSPATKSAKIAWGV
jgi:hypothetical protein